MREKIVSILTLAVAFILGGAFSYYVVIQPNQGAESDHKLSGSSNNGVLQCANDITVNEASIAPAVGKIYDAVVMLENYQKDKLAGTGSGFVYKTDENYAYIMTNHHVISGASKVVVVMSNDDEVEGTVLGSDQYLDLAVVAIKKESAIQVAKIGSSEQVSLGDTVFTVGAPLGYEYRGSVTKGTLSGKNRMVSVSVASNDDWIMSVLQVDAAINPGNSGGPLLNINGEVIGINSLKLVKEEVEGMGFAIPIEDALQYVSILEAGKKIERPLIGITMANVTDTYLLYQNGIRLDSDVSEGVVVIGTSNGSGAALAGLKKGDVITKLEDKPVKNAAYLKYELYKHNPGDKVRITYIRNGSEETASVSLTKVNE